MGSSSSKSEGLGLDLDKVAEQHKDFTAAAAPARASSTAGDDLPWLEVRNLARQSHFSTRDVRQLFALFKKLATASPEPQYIQRYQFQEALREAGFAEVDLEDDVLVGRLFASFDKAKNDKVDFTEFLLGLSFSVRGTPADKVKLAFEIYDQDGTGLISKQEMVALLTRLRHNVVSTLSAEDVELAQATEEEKQKALEAFVDSIFEQYDREMNGRLSFDEFFRAVMGHPILLRMNQGMRDGAGDDADPSAAGSEGTDAQPALSDADVPLSAAHSRLVEEVAGVADPQAARRIWEEIGLRLRFLQRHEYTGELLLAKPPVSSE